MTFAPQPASRVRFSWFTLAAQVLNDLLVVNFPLKIDSASFKKQWQPGVL